MNNTAEALQILCTNCMIIVSRQLGDYFPGGKFNIDSSPNFEKLKETSVNVSTTNIVSERDFANLDRLRREKPNANTIALEGMILFTNNKTLHWLDNLDAEKKSSVKDGKGKCTKNVTKLQRTKTCYTTKTYRNITEKER